jgi:hypothetical protein
MDRQDAAAFRSTCVKDLSKHPSLDGPGGAMGGRAVKTYFSHIPNCRQQLLEERQFPDALRCKLWV